MSIESKREMCFGLLRRMQRPIFWRQRPRNPMSYWKRWKKWNKICARVLRRCEHSYDLPNGRNLSNDFRRSAVFGNGWKISHGSLRQSKLWRMRNLRCWTKKMRRRSLSAIPMRKRSGMFQFQSKSNIVPTLQFDVRPRDDVPPNSKWTGMRRRSLPQKFLRIVWKMCPGISGISRRRAMSAISLRTGSWMSTGNGRRKTRSVPRRDSVEQYVKVSGSMPKGWRLSWNSKMLRDFVRKILSIAEKNFGKQLKKLY